MLIGCLNLLVSTSVAAISMNTSLNVQLAQLPDKIFATTAPLLEHLVKHFLSRGLHDIFAGFGGILGLVPIGVVDDRG